MGDLVTWDLEKAEVLNDISASVFTDRYSSHTGGGKNVYWKKEEPPALEADQARDHLRNVKVHESMRSDEMYLREMF